MAERIQVEILRTWDGTDAKTNEAAVLKIVLPFFRPKAYGVTLSMDAENKVSAAIARELQPMVVGLCGDRRAIPEVGIHAGFRRNSAWLPQVPLAQEIPLKVGGQIAREKDPITGTQGRGIFDDRLWHVPWQVESPPLQLRPWLHGDHINLKVRAGNQEITDPHPGRSRAGLGQHFLEYPSIRIDSDARRRAALHEFVIGRVGGLEPRVNPHHVMR